MTLEKTFPAELEELDNAIAFIEEQMEIADVPMKTVMRFNVAFEEIFVNIAHYAYPDSTGEVILTLTIENNSIILCLTDHGIPFDPLAKPDPDVTLNAEERKIGGLGIYMVKKSMDQVLYEYKDGSNNLTMIAKF